MNSGGLFTDQPTQQLANVDLSGGADEAPDGRITYHVQHANGQSGSIGDQEILRQLTSAGLQPTGLSRDARLISFNSQQGPYQVPVEQALGKLGWQVTGKDFNDSVRDYVNPALSFAINTPSLSSDQAKHDFLTSYLQHHGIEQPHIEGSGDDWHVLDPETGKYVALTKGQGAGMDDVAKYGAKAPSFLGAVLGTGMGAGAGPLGMAAGSAGGGFLGGRLADAGGAMVDPHAYGDALSKQGFQQTATDWAKSAGVDALGGLGAAGIAKAFPAAAQGGIASRAAQGVGRVMEAGGGGAADLAGKMATGLPREFGMAMMDPTGATMLGDTLQLGAQAIKGGARVVDHAAPHVGNMLQQFGSHPGVEELAPGIAGRLRSVGQNLRWRAPQSFEGMTAEEALHGTPFKGVGAVADSAEKLGQGITAVPRAAYTGVMRGAQGAGRATEAVGAGLKRAGQYAAPYETNALNHMGSEEMRARLLKRQRDLQLQGVERRLVPDAQLASDPDDLFQPPI